MTMQKKVSTTNFTDIFKSLGADFYQELPQRSYKTRPQLLHFNQRLNQELGLNWDNYTDDEKNDLLSGGQNFPKATPLAQVYSGHQFGQWAGQLGDGRAALIAQLDRDAGLTDLQLKGSGATEYSRGGDGKAVLRSTIREYLASEALHQLKIPTTEALAIFETGETVQRETEEPGALLLRTAPSHIRFGHFEHFFYNDRPDLVQKLANYVIQNFEEGVTSYEDWFLTVCEKTARLIAQWQAVGFSHGVMNTDNMSIHGITLDYGPYGFMEAFNEDYICNHSDVLGRYRFSNQPNIAHWNLQALACALQPIIPLEAAKEILAHFPEYFSRYYQAAMAEKLGFSASESGDAQFYIDYLSLLQKDAIDYTNSFKRLEQALETGQENLFVNLCSPEQKPLAKSFIKKLTHRQQNQSENPLKIMASANPFYILRNWVAETAIRHVEDHQDIKILETIFAMLQAPYTQNEEYSIYAQQAPEAFQRLVISCSS